jgi:hypothetical protein
MSLDAELMISRSTKTAPCLADCSPDALFANSWKAVSAPHAQVVRDYAHNAATNPAGPVMQDSYTNVLRLMYAIAR